MGRCGRSRWAAFTEAGGVLALADVAAAGAGRALRPLRVSELGRRRAALAS